MQASMQQSNIRQVLMKRIQMCEFALIEAGLFLDSHPDDQQALKYYSKHQQLLDQAKAEYVKQFGALEPTVMVRLCGAEAGGRCFRQKAPDHQGAAPYVH